MSRTKLVYCAYNPVTDVLDIKEEEIVSREDMYPLIDPWIWVTCEMSVRILGKAWENYSD